MASILGLVELRSPAICSRCRHDLMRQYGTGSKLAAHWSRSFSTGKGTRAAAVMGAYVQGLGARRFFWHNGTLQSEIDNFTKIRRRRSVRRESTVATNIGAGVSHSGNDRDAPTDGEFTRPRSTEEEQTEPTHRSAHGRRKPTEETSTPTEADTPIPLDASNRLSTLSAAMPTHSLRRLFTIYLSLSKPRLTFLIVLTTTAAYSLYPVPSLLSTAVTHTPSLSTLTLLFLTTGTFLTSACANALNMMMEPAHDAKMSRTRNRPLVRGLITQRGAAVFALATGLIGTVALYMGVNPTTAFLGFSNILLYAFVYTPMKRIHVVNTWVGAVVGGIPPLMGWTAAAGQCATGSGGWEELLLGPGSAGGWLLAALLYAWQFPHFNALSWTIREEYKHAGYKMLAWTNSKRNGRVALRYSILMIPICVGLGVVGVVEKAFVPLSMLPNGWMLYEAIKFYRFDGTKGSARGLFWASVWHLPVVLVMAMALKKGLWDRVWEALFGRSADDLYYDDDEEDNE